MILPVGGCPGFPVLPSDNPDQHNVRSTRVTLVTGWGGIKSGRGNLKGKSFNRKKISKELNTKKLINCWGKKWMTVWRLLFIITYFENCTMFQHVETVLWTAFFVGYSVLFKASNCDSAENNTKGSWESLRMKKSNKRKRQRIFITEKGKLKLKEQRNCASRRRWLANLSHRDARLPSCFILPGKVRTNETFDSKYR